MRIDVGTLRALCIKPAKPRCLWGTVSIQHSEEDTQAWLMRIDVGTLETLSIIPAKLLSPALLLIESAACMTIVVT